MPYVLWEGVLIAAQQGAPAVFRPVCTSRRKRADEVLHANGSIVLGLARDILKHGIWEANGI